MFLNKQHEAAKGRDKKAIARKLKEAELELKMLEGRLQTLKSDKKIEEAANNIVKLKTDQNTQNDETVRLTDIQVKHHQNIVAEAKKELDAINEKKNKFQDFLKQQQRTKELLQGTLNGNREEVELQHAINDAVLIHGEQNRQKITDILTANQGLEEQASKTKEVGDAAEGLKDQFKQIGESVRQDLVGNLREAITGSQSFGEALGNVLNNLKNKLLDIALDKAIQGIGKAIMPSGGGGGFFSGLFGRARGGPVSAGGAFVVGERGPEILQMGSKGGNIIPNNKIGGGGTTNMVTVNVDASGSSVQGNSADAQQLGQVIGQAVKAQLIKEKRAGGLLA